MAEIVDPARRALDPVEDTVRVSEALDLGRKMIVGQNGQAHIALPVAAAVFAGHGSRIIPCDWFAGILEGRRKPSIMLIGAVGQDVFTETI